MSVRVRPNLVIKQQGKQYKEPLYIPHLVSAITDIWPHLFHLFPFFFFSLVKYLKEMPVIKSFQPHIR